jgi:ribose transport system ATP-binding protein
MSKQNFSLKQATNANSSKVNITLDNIGMSFSGVSVLRGVTLNIVGGEIHTLMGENGAGKSTLVKIISGVQKATEGSMKMNGEELILDSPRAAKDAGIVIMHQELSLVPDMTVAENVMLGQEPIDKGFLINREKLRAKAKSILSHFGFDLDVDKLVKHLRVGEQQLVEIARALLLDARVLIMDEPTSALSQTESDILLEVVRDLALKGVAVIYISHRMDEVFEISDRVTVLRDGNHIATKSVLDTTSSELVEMMVGRAVEIQRIDRKVPPSNQKILSVNNLSWIKDGRKMLDDISFDLCKGEVLGIGGLLGAGRTELLELLFGARGLPTSGTIDLQGSNEWPRTPADAVKAGLSLITEDRKGNGLLLEQDICNNIALPLLPLRNPFGIKSKQMEITEANKAIEKLSIAATGVTHVVGRLSGGNQQKVVLGKWLATNPSILLLDEPTRGIDIGAKDEIYELIAALADSGLSVIFVSSEIPEYLAVCNRMIVLCDGKVSGALSTEQISVEKIKELSMNFSGY